MKAWGLVDKYNLYYRVDCTKENEQRLILFFVRVQGVDTMDKLGKEKL